MDKHTLSQYGWAVIVVIIIAILLGCSTPFGNFIGGFVTDFIEKVDPFPGEHPEPEPGLEPEDNRPRTSSYLRNISLESYEMYGGSDADKVETLYQEIVSYVNQHPEVTPEKALWNFAGANSKDSFEAAMCARNNTIVEHLYRADTSSERICYTIHSYDQLIEEISKERYAFDARENARIGDAASTFITNNANTYKVIFESSLPTSSITTCDLSYDKDGSVVGYMTNDSFFGIGSKPVMHIAGNGVIKAPESMYRFFLPLRESLRVIDFNNALDVSETISFSDFFIGLNLLELKGLENFVTTSLMYMNECAFGITSYSEEKPISIDISSWNFEKVVRMNQCFANFSGGEIIMKNISLPSLEILGEEVEGFFDVTYAEKIDVSGWDAPKLRIINNLFCNHDTINFFDMSHLNAPVLEEVIFANIDGTRSCNIKNINVSYWNTTALEEMKFPSTGSGYYVSDIETINMSNFNAPLMTTLEVGFPSLISIDLSNSNLSSVSIWDFSYHDTTSLFFNCTNLESVNLNNLNLSSAKNVDNFFEGCIKLKTINMNGLNLSALENASCLFKNCTSLESVDFNGVEMPNLKNIDNLFEGASSLKSYDAEFCNLPNLTTALNLCKGCVALTTIHAPKFKAPYLIDRTGSFNDCTNLKKFYYPDTALDCAICYAGSGLTEDVIIPKYIPEDSDPPYAEICFRALRRGISREEAFLDFAGGESKEHLEAQAEDAISKGLYNDISDYYTFYFGNEVNTYEKVIAALEAYNIENPNYNK